MKTNPTTKSICLAIAVFTTAGSSSQAVLLLELTGVPGSNIVTYRASGSITVSGAVPADWDDPNDLGSSVGRAPSGGAWDDGYDNNLGDILSTYDSALNDNLTLSNPVPLLLNNVQMDTTSGAGVRILGNAVFDVIDLDPSDTAGGDDIELDPVTEIVYDALSDGDVISWGDTTGTLTLESGTFDTIFTTGTFSNPGIFDVTITSVPEPSSSFLAVISSGLFLLRRRRA